MIKKYITNLEVYLEFTYFRDKMTINVLYFPMDFNSIFIIALIHFYNSIAFHVESPYLAFFYDLVYLIWSFFTGLCYSSAEIGFISFSYSFAHYMIICSTCTVFCASVSLVTYHLLAVESIDFIMWLKSLFKSFMLWLLLLLWKIGNQLFLYSHIIFWVVCHRTIE